MEILKITVTRQGTRFLVASEAIPGVVGVGDRLTEALVDYASELKKHFARK